MVVNHRSLPKNKPLLLASNHPDSFFDAVVIGSHLRRPIHTLTRGDVFKKPAIAFWLRQINLIPVFRASEGRQYVKNHGTTEQESLDALKLGDAVVVFSEGICVNEWNLRPLGKGTARMAHKVWFGEYALKDMVVVPTGLNYEHFRGPGKRVVLKFGEPIHHNDLTIDPDQYEKWLREFNEILEARLKAQVLHIDAAQSSENQKRAKDEFFNVYAPLDKTNPVLKLIGLIGRLANMPFYAFAKSKAIKLTKNTVFYDSVLYGMLMYVYPAVVGILSVAVGLLFGWSTGLAVFIGLPLLALFGSKLR